MGHAFYSTPIKFKNSPNASVLPFSTSFTFGTVPEFQKLGGHGMAFVISPTLDLSKKALPSQYLGLFSAADIGNLTNHVFAVEFDTVQDFEFGDINDNHIGIDLNSLVSNASVTAAYTIENSTTVNLTMKDGQTIQCWVEYDSVTSLINVTISVSRVKPTKPLISYKYDLSQILNQTMYVGFSGSTGLLPKAASKIYNNNKHSKAF
ncbi:L-type lectin-domain containing receptor kinase S.4-like [Silene latifolia]|uniref:L-type lectin-domain containing receptor kinase S.4-like n=1 Tax=Silene latifolia TaxID=37657 RepID=UPI003D785EB7